MKLTEKGSQIYMSFPAMDRLEPDDQVDLGILVHEMTKDDTEPVRLRFDDWEWTPRRGWRRR
jgi:hypothetical protein